MTVPSSTTDATAMDSIAALGALDPAQPGHAAAAAIRAHRVVAILRGVPPRQVVPTAQALAAGGIAALEITFDGLGAQQLDRTATAIAETVAAVGGRVAVGAGTVLTNAQLDAARRAGASFIVSPDTNPKIIAATRAAGLASLPGAATATECLTAVRAGATFVKLFPAREFGPAYLNALLSPLPWLPIVAVGGVGVDNATDFLDAGAVGLGVGGRLVDKDLIASGQYDQIEAQAAALTSITRREVTR